MNAPKISKPNSDYNKMSFAMAKQAAYKSRKQTGNPIEERVSFETNPPAFEEERKTPAHQRG
jgi:hypothetical protein